MDQPATPVAEDGFVAGANLLLVEDEEQVRSTTADYLEGNGHRVTVAANGAEALAHLDNQSLVDLLITDVGLPGLLNGRQAADAARARRPGLKVLFITGYAAGALDAELAPGMAVLAKPFGMATLETRIREMLAT